MKITAGDITITPMLDSDKDYQIMSKWLSDPAVYFFIHGEPYNISRVREKYGKRVRKEENVNACFIEYQNHPIGYIQYFPVAKAKDYELKSNKNAWAIDMWIGEPKYWGKGIGSQTLNLLADYIFKKLKAKKIVMDPHVDNPRAVRAYEKSGFKKVKILKAHEEHSGVKVDCWLMEQTK